MNNYQSMELHHGAFFSNGHYTDIAEETPYQFVKTNQSAVDAGLIKFHDSDDVSSLPEFQGPYGVPIEIDRSYLDLILNAKKLNISLDFYISTSFAYPWDPTEPKEVYGGVNVTGSFDRLRLGLGESLVDIPAYRGQLEYGSVGYSLFSLKALVQKRNLDGDRVSQIHPKRYSQIFGPNPQEQSEIDSGPILFPSLFVSYIETVPFGGGVEDPWPAVETSDSYSQSTEKAGSFVVSAKAKSAFYSNEVSVSVRIDRVIITPTKVYIKPVIGGYLFVDAGALFLVIFTSDPESLRGNNDYWYYYPPEKPFNFIQEPSTINFFGKSVPIFFISNYPADYYGLGTLDVSSPIITSSSSFDITKEEAYPDTP
jgi:hypothetical protein